jgi:acyl-CoA reductase-like NAD-dependent aldehyde dehydrogenase
MHYKVKKQFYNDRADISKVGRIVNKAHWKRITSLLSASKGKILFGGKIDEESLFIEPTALTEISASDPLVSNELFAPILPIVKYKDFSTSMRLLKELSPTPLAFYVFSEDLQEAQKYVDSVLAGSAAINDVMAQVAPTSLPFGGVGNSGYGAYRGKSSIEIFSHRQTVVTVPTVPAFEAMLEWRYPYSESIQTVEFVKTAMQAPLT